MAKKFSKKRLGRLIDGIVKWVGIVVLTIGLFNLTVSVYHIINKTASKEEFDCSKILYAEPENELKDSQIISRNNRYLACTTITRSEEYGKRYLQVDGVILGVVILGLRFIGKKTINYLWTEEKE